MAQSTSVALCLTLPSIIVTNERVYCCDQLVVYRRIDRLTLLTPYGIRHHGINVAVGDAPPSRISLFLLAT